MEKETRELVLGTVAVVISVLAAGFTGWQAYEARQARIDARDAAQVARQDAKDAAALARQDAEAAARQQLDVANRSRQQSERSAKAAEASASIAAQSLHISERAYVDIDAGLTSIPKVGEKISYRAFFSNSGRTPASDVATDVRAGIHAASLPVEQAHDAAFGPNAQMSPYKSKGVISQGGKVQTNWQSFAPLSQAEWDGLANHQILLYVFASVTYRDEFHRPHMTRFCGYFDPATQGGVLTRCSSLNTAD